MSATVTKIKAVLIDLSGTLHIGDAPIPGAVESLARLKSSNLRLKFVTNTTKESKRLLTRRLLQIGFQTGSDDIFTAMSAARHLVVKMGVRPLLIVDDNSMEDFQDLPTSEPNCVVIGLAPNRFNYQTMNEAFRLVLAGAPLIAINKGRYYEREDGLALGAGPFVAALEYATNRKAEVVGKPEADFFLSALESLDCAAEEAVMIGDDVHDDVLGAQAAGMVGMLVKTGKYREGDESKGDTQPNYVFRDFNEAVDFILKTLA